MVRDATGEARAGSTAILTLLVPGEVPGEVREIPLRYMVHDPDVFVVAPADPLPAWARALQATGPVEWRIGDRVFSGEALPVPRGDAIGATLLGELARDHGEARVRSWFGPQSVAFLLRSRSVRGLSDANVLEAHFDRLAPDYDRLVAANRLDATLRQVSVATLLRTFRPGDRVVEIGCGTGLETLALARAGLDVLALDISQRMLDLLEAKARAEDILPRITTRKMRASDLGSLVLEFGNASFQGAFSDFGALNLEPNLGDLPRVLGELIRADGAVVLGIWNRVCLAEMALYAFGLRPRRALARLSSPVPVGLSRFGLPAYPRAPGPFLAAFRPAFTVERLEALPFLVPPYDFLRHIPRPDRLLPLLESIDGPVRTRFPFNRLGDHFLATLRRR